MDVAPMPARSLIAEAVRVPVAAPTRGAQRLEASKCKVTELAGSLLGANVGSDAVVNARGDGRERGTLQQRGAGRRQDMVSSKGVEDE